MAFDFRCNHHGGRMPTTSMMKKHKNGNTTTTTASWSLVLVLLAILASPSTATITLMDSGKSFGSRQETAFGVPLLSGYEYMGRLQYIPENPTLCPGKYPHQKFDIVNPSDGLPVALVAKKGGCSFLEKAIVASSLINPLNAVGYLILQDDSKHQHHLSLFNNPENNKTTMEGIINLENNIETWKEYYPSQIQQQNGNGLIYNFFSEDDDEYHREVHSLPSLAMELELAEQNGRSLLERIPYAGTTPNNNNNNNNLETVINLSVLHVNFGTGEELLDILADQDPRSKRKGGPRVLLNGKGSAFFGTKTIVFWMLIVFSVCACGCACLLICVQTGLEEEVQAPAPRRPVRRRLTLEEVRARFPSYHYNNNNESVQQQQQDETVQGGGCCPTHHDNGVGPLGEAAPSGGGYIQMTMTEECTICLDEFVDGVRVRKLPCGHIFHSTCIARWLIERHAVCPLCKLDLYIEPPEEDSDSSDSDSEQEAAEGQQQFFWNGWFNTNNNINSEGYTQLEVPSGAAEAAEPLLPNEGGGGEEEEPRSWWPFSLEVAVNEEEEEQQQQQHQTNRPRFSPVSAAASMFSSIWSRNSSSSSSNSIFWGRSRRRHLHRHHQDIAESANHLTELTEPLVTATAASSPQAEDTAAAVPSTPPPPASQPAALQQQSHSSETTTTSTAAEI